VKFVRGQGQRIGLFEDLVERHLAGRLCRVDMQ